MPEDHFGERVAAGSTSATAQGRAGRRRPDRRRSWPSSPDDGDALELGIGTGRIALPLAQRGVRVHGIDLSEAMVARLRAKPGAERIDVTIGDFATTRSTARSLSRTSSRTRS